jgi:O-antigen/teichoic acid export membrane protein
MPYQSHDNAGEWTTVVEGGGVVLIAALLGNGLNYLFSIFLARMVGPDTFGVFALGVTVFNTVALILIFGLDAGVTRLLSHHLAAERFDRARRTVWSAAGMGGMLGLLGGALLWFFAPAVATALYHQPALSPVLRWFAAALPAAVVAAICLSALQSFLAVRYTVLVKYLWEPTGKFVLAGLLLAAGWGLVGAVGGIVLTLTVSALCVLIALSRVTRNGRSRIEWSRDEIRSLMAFGLPLSVGQIFAVLAPRSDIFILGYWVSTQEVGVYLAAFQTAAVLALVLGSFESLYAPMLARCVAARQWNKIQDLYRAMARLTVMLVIPVCLLLVIFAREVLGWFGEPFVAGAGCLVFLALGHLLCSPLGGSSALLVMAGHTRLTMINTIVMGLAMIAGTAALVPPLGVWGAALSATASLILTNVLRVAELWWLYRVHPFTGTLLKPVLAGLIVAGVLAGIRPFLQGPFILLAAFVGSCLYVATLIMLGLEREDRAAIVKICGRGVPATALGLRLRRVSS